MLYADGQFLPALVPTPQPSALLPLATTSASELLPATLMQLSARSGRGE